MSENAALQKASATEMSAEEIFTVAMDIGDSMLTVGAEVNRVEDTVIRICRAYGVVAEVFSVTSLIIATARTKEGNTFTQTRRNLTRGTDFRRLEDYNALSRYICTNLPSVEEIKEKKAAIDRRNTHKLVYITSGHIFGVGGFVLLFGGGLVDCAVAVAIALVMMIMGRYLRPPDSNVLIYNLVCSVMASALAIGALKSGIPISLDKVMISDIMVLIPGMAITNSIRDMFCGDIMTGLLRFSEAVLVSAAIAAGFSIPMMVFGV